MDIVKDKSYTISFVVASLFHEAVNNAELNLWADNILAGEADYPPYIVELASFNRYPKDIFEIIGFTPDRKLTGDQRKALTGIAYLRGTATPYAQYKKKTALEALNKNPDILSEFKSIFPFISID